MGYLELLFDPTVLFCVSCIVMPLALDGRSMSSLAQPYLTHPLMVFTLFIGITVVAEAKYGGPTHRLSWPQRMLARWYLLNGLIIHILMDGCVGVFQANELFANQYKRLDERYGEPLGSLLGSTVHIVSLGELFLVGPLCLLVYRAYHRGSPSRDILEVIVCVLQLYGMIIYLGQEVLTGGKSFQVDKDFTFSRDALVYFWFAVVFGNAVYFIFPVTFGANAMRRIIASQATAPKRIARRDE